MKKELTPILVFFCDWKEQLDQKEIKQIRKYCKETPDSFWEEIPVTTSDDRVFVAAPMTFFETYNKQKGKKKYQFPNGCGMADIIDIQHNLEELISYSKDPDYSITDYEEFKAVCDYYWDGELLYISAKDKSGDIAYLSAGTIQKEYEKIQEAENSETSEVELATELADYIQTAPLEKLQKINTFIQTLK